MAATTRFCIFLRAINTGNRRVTNEQLLAPFSTLGCADVAAYQAAGNVVLLTNDAGSLHHDRLDPLLAAAYGFDAPSFVVSIERLRTVIVEQPFTGAQLAETEGRVQVGFLRGDPPPRAIAELDDIVPADDRVVIRGDVLYWLPREGISGSKLNVAKVEAIVGPLTIRTLGTLERLVDKFADPDTS